MRRGGSKAEIEVMYRSDDGGAGGGQQQPSLSETLIAKIRRRDYI